MTALRQAAWPQARALAWLPPAAGAALAIGVLAGDRAAIPQLRLGAVALCAGCAFVLDDVAHATLSASPTPLRSRRALRVALVLSAVATVWGCMLAGVRPDVWAPLTLEFAAMLAVTLACASAAARLRGDGHGGWAGSAALPVLLGVAALALPEGWSLFPPDPGDPRWDGAHARWAGVLVLAAAVLGATSRDPARRAFAAPRWLPRAGRAAAGRSGPRGHGAPGGGAADRRATWSPGAGGRTLDGCHTKRREGR